MRLSEQPEDLFCQVLFLRVRRGRLDDVDARPRHRTIAVNLEADHHGVVAGVQLTFFITLKHFADEVSYRRFIKFEFVEIRRLFGAGSFSGGFGFGLLFGGFGLALGFFALGFQPRFFFGAVAFAFCTALEFALTQFLER